MENQLISYKTAVLAKELGFNESCINFYTSNSHEIKQINLKGLSNSDFILFCSAPTQSLLQRWLREKHNIRVFVSESFHNSEKYDAHIYDSGLNFSTHKTYEEALENGLYKGLLLIKNDEKI